MICRCLQTRSSDRRLPPASPSRAAKRSEVSTIKMPSSGGASGSMNAMLGNATSMSFDLRYLSDALDTTTAEDVEHVYLISWLLSWKIRKRGPTV